LRDDDRRRGSAGGAADVKLVLAVSGVSEHERERRCARRGAAGSTVVGDGAA
jgi:hypothetical protein